MTKFVAFTPKNRIEALREFWLGLIGYKYSFKQAMAIAPLSIERLNIRNIFHVGSSYYVQFFTGEKDLLTLKIKHLPTELIAEEKSFYFLLTFRMRVIALSVFWAGIVFVPMMLTQRTMRISLKSAAHDFMAAVYSNSLCDVHCTRRFMDLNFEILFRTTDFALICVGLVAAYFYIRQNKMRSGEVFRILRMFSWFYLAGFVKIILFPANRPNLFHQISQYKEMKKNSDYTILSALKMNLEDKNRELSSED